MQEPGFGFHLSISKGIASAATEAASKNYKVFQLFVSNPRMWRFNRPDQKSADEFIETTRSKSITPFAHMPYICNLASPRDEIYKKSIDIAIQNMNECDALGIRNLVFHMGSHLGSGAATGKERLKNAIYEILENTGDTNMLLENSAGYSNSMGSSISEIVQVINDIGSARVGMCIDTCHLFAAGYDLSKSEVVSSISSGILQTVGSNTIKLVHLNDSKYPLGSGLDRHWHIGKGYIGEKGFINLFADKMLGAGPFVMETPYENEKSEEQNLRNAIRLFKKAKEANTK
ncbi:MAG: deoxyribonuclease IV [Candidatus Micrarchaeia archaeon]